MTQGNFGRYQIKSEIGRGGMATVFFAYDPRFERDVAIKVLPQALLHDPQFRARFEREAKTIALLEHPAIVPVYDFGEEEGQPYIVMRYMAGGSLAERLNQGPLDLSGARQIITRLAPALDAAHARGIIHRDLKPGNILFDQYGNACLSDFGIARLVDATTATLTGEAIVGTPAYMSPEQIQGDKDLDGRSDIYSMGIILYQMLAGNTPYQADTPAKLMMKHLLEPVPLIRAARADIPTQIESIIARALAKEPVERFATTADLAAGLAQAVRGEGDPTIHTSGPGPASRANAESAPATVAGRAFGETRPITPPPDRPLTPPPAPAGKRKGVPIWGIALAVLLLLGFLGGGGAVVWWAASTLLDKPLVNAPPATQVLAIAQASDTHAPTSTLSPPTATSTLPPTSTETPAPTSTGTPPPATPTPEPSPTQEPAIPAAPVTGGADWVAFVNANEIWAAHLDGSDLVKLTTDGGSKSNLQWGPDGESIFYLMGKCIYQVSLTGGRVDVVTCFNSAESVSEFEISRDGEQVAISVNNELFIVPFDLEKLAKTTTKSGLVSMAGCKEFAPLQEIFIKTAQWAHDGQSIAAVFLSNDPTTGKRIDLIDILNVGACRAGRPSRIDQFPSTRFTISGYEQNPFIQNFSWDGRYLFALTSNIRNDGFGDLYIYNHDLHKAQLRINPIDGKCCYRDPVWSPDGTHLLFAFQEYSAENKIELYYIPYGTVGAGVQYTPIPLPDAFFSQRTSKPWAVLRPAQ